MDPFATRRLGRTRLALTALGFGGTAVGSLYQKTAEDAGRRTIAHAYEAGLRYFDTAPYYGHGSSERRFGAVLSGRPRSSFVLSTKVGRLLRPIDRAARRDQRFADDEPFEALFDYSGDAVMRSIESSLTRLGLDRIDILFIHDVWTREHFEAAMAGAYPALDRLRREGQVAAIGAGIGRWEMCRDFALAGDFDCFLLANRYTLLEQGGALHEFLPLCADRGIGIVIGGPYNSGILASGAVPGAMYNYEPATPAVLDRVCAIERVCATHDVPLAAAALRFPLGHPNVASVIPGAKSAAEVDHNIALMQTDIPTALWRDLQNEGLVDPAAPTPA